METDTVNHEVCICARKILRISFLNFSWEEIFVDFRHIPGSKVGLVEGNKVVGW